MTHTLTTDRTCIIVVNVKETMVGLIVEEIAGVVEIQDENILPPHSISAARSAASILDICANFSLTPCAPSSSRALIAAAAKEIAFGRVNGLTLNKRGNDEFGELVDEYTKVIDQRLPDLLT